MSLVSMKVHRTKVYQLFCALTLQERKDFVRFLRRRSRAKRDKIKLAFRFLCLNVSAIDQGKSSNEDWWQHAFPNAQYDARALRKHQNALIHELEQFLADRKLHKEIDAYTATVRPCRATMTRPPCNCVWSCSKSITYKRCSLSNLGQNSRHPKMLWIDIMSNIA